jgi:hypothetical protein
MTDETVVKFLSRKPGMGDVLLVARSGAHRRHAIPRVVRAELAVAASAWNLNYISALLRVPEKFNKYFDGGLRVEIHQKGNSRRMKVFTRFSACPHLR